MCMLHTCFFGEHLDILTSSEILFYKCQKCLKCPNYMPFFKLQDKQKKNNNNFKLKTEMRHKKRELFLLPLIHGDSFKVPFSN